ncbi:hypothetical protein ACFVUY_37110 [Kitasatospora sp. NPDC058063]|uniref:hypothetical protein n=1 Tax=unclassified Kitasatospora TaxID=2633591 RepID=UPI0036DF0A29
MKDRLDASGVRWVEVENAEADDVIATLAARAATSRPVLIMSRDMDFYQLLDDHVRVLNRSRKSSQRIITADEVIARFGVTPAQWPAFRALTGDKADNIPASTASARRSPPPCCTTACHCSTFPAQDG